MINRAIQERSRMLLGSQHFLVDSVQDKQAGVIKCKQKKLAGYPRVRALSPAALNKKNKAP